jgi:glycosidase
MKDKSTSMREKLILLYGQETGEDTHDRLMILLQKYVPMIPKKRFDFSHQDVVLITYGDGFLSSEKKPLEVLHEFLNIYAKNSITIVHILPFFPYSSDDGFSVIDYRTVNSRLGTWDHIKKISAHFHLMFDAVINHISSKSKEFQEFLKGNPAYKDYFIITGPDTDISRVFRPRALPLLTQFQTERGPLSVWTTFSADQTDLNFKNPEVFLFIIDVLLLYIVNGASMIRLDAIAYLWKESGTNCLHLPQTHMVVKLFRDIFEQVAPHVKILTETNVPHRENISYFGNGEDEAQMVYNFALPPLTAYSIITGDATPLTLWSRTLEPPSINTYFYNFTASHDGIGILPAKDLLTNEQIEDIIKTTEKRGGRVSYKSNPDGSKSAYELNIALFDLLSDPGENEPTSKKVDRFIASQAIALSLKGVPALYYHSLLGSRNYHEGVKQTGANRAINREKLQIAELKWELETPGTVRNLVFQRLTELIQKRRSQKAFHPQGKQHILNLHPGIFALERHSPDGEQCILCLINVSDSTVDLTLDHPAGKDILSGRVVEKNISIKPYEVLWLLRDPQN